MFESWYRQVFIICCALPPGWKFIYAFRCRSRCIWQNFKNSYLPQKWIDWLEIADLSTNWPPLNTAQFLDRSDKCLWVFPGRGPMAPPLTIRRVENGITPQPLITNREVGPTFGISSTEMSELKNWRQSIIQFNKESRKGFHSFRNIYRGNNMQPEAGHCQRRPFCL